MVRQRQGPLAGIIHLLPLRPGANFEEMDFAAWRERLRLEVKSLFYLARAASADLKRSGAADGGWLVAVTAMSGTFATDSLSGLSGQALRGSSGEDPTPRAFFPGQGGLAGLVKTVALEWPDVQCKVIDFDPQEPISTVLHQLLREMTQGDGQVEVGYRGSRRLLVQPTLASLNRERPARLAIGSNWVVLVTGGARGIMAEVAHELAERYQPTLVLCGRSPLPESEESGETAGLTSARELKAVLIAQMRRAGEMVTPAQVEAAYSRLLKDRQMRASIAAMRVAGARVHYYRVDVRDEEAFGSLIEEIYHAYGRLDGVIHGAGVIEDKLIEDKTSDSFDRVFDTKADSVFILSRALRPHSLKFLVLFASAAGRFGNRGQCDYAAGNEVMNKLAEYLNHRWPGRVVSINWGPWLKRGMVSPELQRQFAERGVQLIPISTGRRILDRELRYDRKEEVEVIVASGGEWGIAEPAGKGAFPTSLPLLQDATLSTGANGAIEVIRMLDPSQDLYLDAHQLDGKPVMPIAAVIELMAEVASQGWPELEVVGLRDIHVLKGIVIEEDPMTVRVAARPEPHSRLEQTQMEVYVEITDPSQAGQLYYHAILELANQLPEPPWFESPYSADMRPFHTSVDEAYRRYLFQGPLLQNILEIEAISEEGIVGTLAPSSPQQVLTGARDGHWLIDPVVLEGGFQLVIVWARVYGDKTPLPSVFHAYYRFGSLSDQVIRCHVYSYFDPGGVVMHTDLYWVDSEGRVLGLLKDAESVCSKALNRLPGSQFAQARNM